jgi:Zn-dependent alcohol dehydrogenase
MRGIVYTTDGVEITEELSVRDPGPKEVRVGIGAAGVCHSDLSVINRTIPFPPPVVLGHEGAGVVEAVGADVRSVKVGDHVVIATLANCGTCRACSTGHPTQCRRSLGNIDTPFTFKGQPAYNFAAASVFAESTVVQEVQAVKIPKDVPLTSACLIACGVLTGVGAVLNRARVRPGETAAVFGVGGVGLNVIQGLRIAGATRIVAVDTVAAKEALGRQFGATDFVDASSGDAAAAVRALVPPDRERASGSLSPQGGVTWAFDCVGHPAVLRSALDCLDWGGNAVAIGIPPQGTEVAVDVNALAYVDRGLMGNRYGSARPHHDIPLMIDLYQSGRLLLDELVSLTRPLEAFGEIVEEMEAGRVARGVLTFD